jgi:hypothetical protein
MVSARKRRMYENCKVIWGMEFNCDISVKSSGPYDYTEYWTYYVRKDFDIRFGDVLVATPEYCSEKRACDEMERMLAFGARQKQRQQAMERHK